MPPTTQYALSGDVAIAYQVFGSGPLDLVITPGAVSHVELQWENRHAARFLERLARFARVLIFDKRGTGMSDRVATGTLEERMDDVRAVMDAAGSERAALFGVSEGGPLSILFAATYPARTQALLLFGTFARIGRGPDYPFGRPREEIMPLYDQLVRTWGEPNPAFLESATPSLADDPELLVWWAKYLRVSASPGAFFALMRMNLDIDVRHVLPSIHVPTLVLHRTGDRVVEIGRGRHLAEHIADATFVELPGTDHFSFVGDTDAIVDEVEEFLTGTRHAPEVDRVLTTVLFTDIVGSTARAAALGDHAWGELNARHYTLARRELARYRGREVNTAGDGFFATFDGPARAVRCAAALRDAVRPLGLEVRAGLHTGEVELHGDQVSGLAVHIGARVGALAGAGEVLVSSTVKDLVAGAGITFEDRGGQVLKGVPGEWRLFAVTA